MSSKKFIILYLLRKFHYYLIFFTIFWIEQIAVITLNSNALVFLIRFSRFLTRNRNGISNCRKIKIFLSDAISTCKTKWTFHTFKSVHLAKGTRQKIIRLFSFNIGKFQTVSCPSFFKYLSRFFGLVIIIFLQVLIANLL